MIKASEIVPTLTFYDNRVGKEIHFKTIHGLCNIESKPSDFEPIPLTSEWLERFGFVQDAFDAWNLELTTRFASKTLLIFASDYLYMRQFNTDKRHEDDICTIWNKDIMKHFYVHDLQNLYFALTGQELELKEKS